jgi:hypothetical protein
LLHDSGKTSTVNETSVFAVNEPSPPSYLAYAIDRKVYVKELRTSLEKRGDRELTSPVLALALSYPMLFVMTGCGFVMINWKTQVLTSCNFPDVVSPFSCAVGPKSFFACPNNQNALLINHELNPVGATIELPSAAQDHCCWGDQVASAVSDGVVVFHFQDSVINGRCFLFGTRRLCQFNGSLLAGTKAAVFLLVDVTAIIEDMGTAPPDHTALLLALFDQLWISVKYRRQALRMFADKRFAFAWMDVVKLFPFLVLPDGIRQSKLLAKPGDVPNEFVVGFAQVLLALRQKEVEFSMNSILVQLFAHAGDKEVFSRFVDSTQFDRKLVERYFQASQNHLYPVYLRCLKDYAAAIEVFQDYGDDVEVKETLLQAASDFAFVEARIDWLMTRNPVVALTMFRDPRISPAQGLRLIKSQYLHYYLGALRCVVEQRELPNRERLVNEYWLGVVNLFVDLRRSAFDRSSIRFLECVMKNPNQSLPKIEGELLANLRQVLVSSKKLVDFSQILPIVDSIEKSERKVFLLEALGVPEKAIEMMADWDDDFSIFENICKETPSLYPLFLGHLKPKIPPDEFFEKLRQVVSNSWQNADLSIVLALLGNEATLDFVYDLLERCFLDMDSTRLSKELKVAFLQSDAFETGYEAMVLESRRVELKPEIVCANCGKRLGFNVVERRADGSLCHNYKCAEGLKI